MKKIRLFVCSLQQVPKELQMARLHFCPAKNASFRAICREPIIVGFHDDVVMFVPLIPSKQWQYQQLCIGIRMLGTGLDRLQKGGPRRATGSERHPSGEVRPVSLA